MYYLSSAIYGCHGALGDMVRPGLAQRLGCVCVLALVSAVACLCLPGWDHRQDTASPLYSKDFSLSFPVGPFLFLL